MPIASTNPTTGLIERVFEPHDQTEVELRLGLADAAAHQLRSSTFEDRAAWMHRAADLMEADLEAAAHTMTLEMGKPIGQSRAEVLKCAMAMRFYADNAQRFLPDTPLDDPSEVGADEAWTRFEPIGVILAVMPWNYPLWQVIRFAAPALMAGNAGLLKHASNVPQSAMYLDSLFARAGFPAGAFQTLLIEARGVEAVVRDRRVQAVTLTGSEPAGRSIAAVAGSELKKVILELGGSDPFIVMPSADIDDAANVGVTARVNNNGQSCIAAKRFIVHTDVYDAFIALFIKRTAAQRIGDPMEEETEIGPLANASGRTDLMELLEDARGAGARVALGGNAVEGPGYFFEPTIVENVTPEMRLYTEEAFGPLATVFRVGSAEEAVALANDSTFGLSSAVWTTDPDEVQFFIANLDAGAVFVNGMTISYPQLPFGGIKDSGIGRELAAEGIRELSNVKTIWRRR